VAEFRKAIADKLVKAFAGIAFNEAPNSLSQYLAVAARAHDVIASLGIPISRMRVEDRGDEIEVSVERAVPSMDLVPEEDRPYAMLVSIGILVGIVEGIVGSPVGLRVPNLGIELPGDSHVMEVDADVSANRYIAVIKRVK